jgi:excisionase family DNA binding protein
MIKAEYRTVAQAAARLGVTQMTILRYIARGQLAAERVGNQAWLIPTAAVESFSRPKGGRRKRK